LHPQTIPNVFIEKFDVYAMVFKIDLGYSKHLSGMLLGSRESEIGCGRGEK